MFDQDDLNNLVRAAQLNSQEKTRQAILDLQNQEAGMPKCPWCAGAIEENVSKCRHCTSDIAWVGGEQCKPEDKDKVADKQREQKIRQQRAEEEKRRRDNELIKCANCDEKIKRGDAEKINAFGEARGLCKACIKKEDDGLRNVLCFSLVILVLGLVYYIASAV